MTPSQDIETSLAGMEQTVKTNVRQLNRALTSACDMLEKIKRARHKIYELSRSTMPLSERNAAISHALEGVQRCAEKSPLAQDAA